MVFRFKGTLCGYLCSDCIDELSGVRVRLYRTEGTADVARAAASEKVTLVVLDGDAVEAKKSRLLAETESDGAGNFTFELGEKEDYDGGAFEFDVLVERVSGQ